MPGSPVSIGCMVMVTPGATLAPDLGAVVGILQVNATAGGLPLATAGSICVMINSLTGIPYPLMIGSPASTGVIVSGMPVVRLLDQIPSPPGLLSILGPPVAPYVVDGWPP